MLSQFLHFFFEYAILFIETHNDNNIFTSLFLCKQINIIFSVGMSRSDNVIMLCHVQLFDDIFQSNVHMVVSCLSQSYTLCSGSDHHSQAHRRSILLLHRRQAISHGSPRCFILKGDPAMTFSELLPRTPEWSVM